MKKITLLALFTLLFSSLLITSCSSDDSVSDDSNGVSSGDYWPLAINNQWIYNENGSVASPVKITGTDNFGGTAYYRLSTDNAYNLQVWAAKKGATYFLRTGELNLTENGITVKMSAYELPVLKDNLAVNEQWSGNVISKVSVTNGSASSSFDTTIKYLGIILEKDASITVNGTVYTSVIKMSFRQEVNFQGQTTITESVYWYAKGVGPVKSINTINGSTVESTLVSYIIN
ncbi:hypothetical protein E0I26_01265 [Flavobacterium rhamnosiphilum]|uniref:Uncharacterized protein n=1 Tax=Flavobacterium rhamnosiphilum TaxID=2541724 RepID=A0A4R5FCR2_9FLAO|nr:hypothetical protein [Flavobacterium rhamnosiphilum]TDE46740.1 hypothetical protein E0I26_01265 [Flavobacterium rhamnosiphilum]